jgi:hypothetical protein
MILIYTDSQIQDREWIPRLHFPEAYQITHSEREYISQPADYKIAITTHRLHCDWLDENCAAYQGFEEKIIRLSDASDLVFTLESELHHYHWTIWSQCHRSNVYWVLPGAVNDRPNIQNNIIFWGDWFKTTANIYKNPSVKFVTEQYRPYQVKPRYFDALLGSPKPHRDFVANAVKQHGLEDRFILTYGGAWSNNVFYAKDYFIWEPGCEPCQTIIGTADQVKWYGQECHLSQIIPTEVFNDTAYSIVAETDHDNTLSFFSEKTAKPMIYKRLFVAFSGYKFLQNLRTLGFKTFDGIIDESYDLIINDRARYSAAFEQVRWLCEQDQSVIYNQIRDILEHNYNLIINTDWTQYSVNFVQQRINQLFVGTQDRPTADEL